MNTDFFPRGGRPAKWADGQTLARLSKALADPNIPSKAAAAHVAGIGVATLMRWQATPVNGSDCLAIQLRQAWRSAERSRHLLRRSVAADRAKERAGRSKPTRQIKTVAWLLVHRLHPLETITGERLLEACARVNLSVEGWHAACERFPDLEASIIRKRARRRAYLLAHGEIALGWTPPDPTNYRTAARARGSFTQKRGTFLATLYTHTRNHSPRFGNPWL